METIRRLELLEANGQQGGNVILLILFMVVGTILLSIGFVVTAKTQNQIPDTDLTPEQNATLQDMKTQAADNFSFANLIIYVLVAAGVITAVFGIVQVARS